MVGVTREELEERWRRLKENNSKLAAAIADIMRRPLRCKSVRDLQAAKDDDIKPDFVVEGPRP